MMFCIPSWTPDKNTVCSGVSFIQTDVNCGEPDRTVTGTKSCSYQWVPLGWTNWILNSCYLNLGLTSCDASWVDKHGFSLDGGSNYYKWDGTCGVNRTPIPSATEVAFHTCKYQ